MPDRHRFGAAREPHFVRSFERGLAVIRAFDAEHPALTLSEVARTCELPRAATRRFLLTLVDLGYVHTGGRLFRLTPRTLTSADRRISSHAGRTSVEAVRRDLLPPLLAAVARIEADLWGTGTAAGRARAMIPGVAPARPERPGPAATAATGRAPAVTPGSGTHR
ncbi:helix-turn-helix domain-containing protein [Streptomyces sp. SP18BB07]|nr:helix-turn-helix domain-containing protein [Streptomyces sp. SP18BB07]MEE1762291.1 helix-turn-helix domain-containing protein [Streptomyces sp. SP18BB07]